jgi:hypothetical protein
VKFSQTDQDAAAFLVGFFVPAGRLDIFQFRPTMKADHPVMKKPQGPAFIQGHKFITPVLHPAYIR